MPVNAPSIKHPGEATPKPVTKIKTEKIPVAITPGLEDLVSKDIELKIKMEKVEAQKPKPIPKNSVTYHVVAKLVKEPESYKAIYQNLTRKPTVVEVITPILNSTTSNAILVSNSTVETATTQANERSQQMQRAHQVSHLNIKPLAPKCTQASPHNNILKPYYADTTNAFIDKNGRILAFADTIVQTTPKTAINVPHFLPSNGFVMK